MGVSRVIDFPISPFVIILLLIFMPGQYFELHVQNSSQGEVLTHIRANLRLEVPETPWISTYGGWADDCGDTIIECEAGGFAIVGGTQERGNEDVFFVRTDENGTMLWHHIFGREGWDMGRSLTECEDGGFAIVGDTQPTGSNHAEILLIRTDAVGNQLWNRTYGTLDHDHGNSVVELPEGGFALAGHTGGLIGTDRGLVLRTDQNGILLWNYTYGYTHRECFYSIILCSEGGFLLTGWSSSFSVDNADWETWIVRMDSNGSVIWDQLYGSGYDSNGQAAVECIDRGFCIVGTIRDYEGVSSSQIWMIRIDKMGVMMWNQTYGGNSGRDIIVVADEGIAILGMTLKKAHFSEYWEDDVYVIRTNQTGHVQWSQLYGEGSYDSGTSIVQCREGGYAITGRTNGFSSVGGYDMFLLRIPDNPTPLPTGIQPSNPWVIVGVVLISLVVLLVVFLYFRKRRHRLLE